MGHTTAAMCSAFLMAEDLCHSTAVNVFAPIRLHLSLYVVISVFNEVQCYISAMPFPRDGVSPHKTCIR